MVKRTAHISRNYVDPSFEMNEWSDLEPFMHDLLHRVIDGAEQYNRWLLDISELEALIEEEAAWRYIRMTIDTSNEQASADYMKFVSEIQPQLAPLTDQLNRKIVDSPFASQADQGDFRIYFRSLRNDIALFREENIVLQTELQELAQQYSTITGGMLVTIDGESMTMQKAGALLQRPDRTLREEAFRAIQEVRLQSAEALDELFDQMVAKRHQMALNAGFSNFRDYKFAAMGRFDYSSDDCFRFHDSIANAIVPIAKRIVEKRKKAMGFEQLRPWDLSCDVQGRAPLTPFKDGAELMAKSIELFGRIDTYFGECLQRMHDLGYADLESKPGKAPGGYNYPLYESGVPFIFMNAVGTPRDMVTMMHEGGHAVHSILTHDLTLTAFKGCPSEVAELASMSMELLSLDHWDLFYTEADDNARAKSEHLEDILTMLPWIAMVDAFQHWIYTHPTHTRTERTAKWNELEERFGVGIVDWSGLEEGRSSRWQRQLHIFEVPFYYIEYGMAQLGAIAVWRNYKQDPSEAIEAYKAALKLGYTRSISDIYAAANIRFDFSERYIQELAAFVSSELDPFN